MDNYKSLKEIKDNLRPCPLCGQGVNLRQIEQSVDGAVRAEIGCTCGLTAKLTYSPEAMLFEGSIRNRLLPWEQWNRRYDDA